jgi:gliding motility-associated lipoprotein GldD
MRYYLIKTVLICTTLIFISSCKYKGTPRPRGYFRIEFPEKEYIWLDSVMPYSFLYPKYAQVKPHISSQTEPYFINLFFPEFNATIHITYHDLVNKDLYNILEEFIRLTFVHSLKADDIPEHIFIDDEHNVYGTVFEVKGNAASPLQFYATDSVKHILRGSLYFNTHPNKDSLAPVVKFITEDVFLLMENIRWKN